MKYLNPSWPQHYLEEAILWYVIEMEEKKHILFKFYFVEIWEKREIVTRNCSGAYRNKQ